MRRIALAALVFLGALGFAVGGFGSKVTPVQAAAAARSRESVSDSGATGLTVTIQGTDFIGSQCPDHRRAIDCLVRRHSCECSDMYREFDHRNVPVCPSSTQVDVIVTNGDGSGLATVTADKFTCRPAGGSSSPPHFPEPCTSWLPTGNDSQHLHTASPDAPRTATLCLPDDPGGCQPHARPRSSSRSSRARTTSPRPIEVPDDIAIQSIPASGERYTTSFSTLSRAPFPAPLSTACTSTGATKVILRSSGGLPIFHITA